jgi:hypothetical protein
LFLQPTEGNSDEVGSSSIKMTSESPDAVADDSKPGGLEYNVKTEPHPCQEETKDLVRLPVTANMENATALAAQSQALEPQKDQVESSLDPNTRPAAILVGIFLIKTQQRY